jgi:hypothetical protein
MPVLKIPNLKITRNLREKLLKTKRLESYSAKYVEFVVRITLSGILGDVGSVSAVWNVKQKCWQGNINYLGKNYHWVIDECDPPFVRS